MSSSNHWLLPRVISDQTGAAIDEQIYDDVDSQALVQPPPISRYSDIEQSDTESTFIFCCLFGFVLIIVGLYFVFYLIVLRSSIPHLKGKSKTEEMYPKKQKKMEKEEKEFRRKFKVCLFIISLKKKKIFNQTTFIIFSFSCSLS